MRELFDESVRVTASEISSALDGRIRGMWLYGSVVLGDFRPGWSDIDFLALSSGPISAEQADRILYLRGTLSALHPDNPYFRLFEGVVMPVLSFEEGIGSRAVYWGTSGQRIMDRVTVDAFARQQLAVSGKSVCGEDGRLLFRAPEREEMLRAVRRHLDTIRRYARQTDERLYSCGWLLDIARCVYTVRTGGVISKTGAGEWALENGIFPDGGALERTLAIRRDPEAHKNDPVTAEWLRGLGPTVQRYADVLEKEL